MKTPLQVLNEVVPNNIVWSSTTFQKIIKALEVYGEQYKKETGKLQAFKNYVHNRLDEAGIEKDPESPHRAAGCRIGGRLDIALKKDNSVAYLNKIEEVCNEVSLDILKMPAAIRAISALVKEYKKQK